jgi:outer membrane protein TolC
MLRAITKPGRSAQVALILLAGLAGCAGTQEKSARDQWDRDATEIEEARAAVPADRLAAGPDTTLADYLRRALSFNPRIEAARQDWKAQLERVPQARTLPEPELGYGYFIEQVQTRVGPQVQGLTLSQRFPWFGTLGLQGKAALAVAEASRLRYQDVLLRTARGVTDAYADYYYLGAALRVTRENVDLLRSWESILRSRYTTGSATYSDLNRVQVELGKLEDRIVTLQRQREPHEARLLSLLDLPPEATLPWPSSLPEPAPLPPADTLLSLVRDSNPELQALHALAEGEEKRIDLAKRSYYPDFSLGVDWIQVDPRDVPDVPDNGQDAWIARVKVQLPIWWGKYSAEGKEARARKAAVLANASQTENRLESQMEELLFQYDDAGRKISLYRDSLIPKGEQSLRAAYAGFESGEGDFLGVLDAERILLEFSLLYERANADRIQAYAGILTLIGRRPGAE